MVPLASGLLGFDLRHFFPVKGETELSDDATSPCALAAESAAGGLCATPWTARVWACSLPVPCSVCLCLHGFLVLPGLLLRWALCWRAHARSAPPRFGGILPEVRCSHSCPPADLGEALWRLPLTPPASFSVNSPFCRGECSLTSDRDHIWLHVTV